MEERNRGGDRGSRGGREESPSSEVPAEGVDCSCNRATGRNRAEERGGVDPNTVGTIGNRVRV